MKTPKTSGRLAAEVPAGRLNLPAAFEEVENAIKAANAAGELLFDLQFGELVHYRPEAGTGLEDLTGKWECLFEMAANTITNHLPEALETLKKIEAATAPQAGGAR